MGRHIDLLGPQARTLCTGLADIAGMWWSLHVSSPMAEELIGLLPNYDAVASLTHSSMTREYWED